MKNRIRERMMKKAERLAKATRAMRIQRLIWRRVIKSADTVPPDAIPADPDQQNKGVRWGERSVRFWYQDKSFHCKDCRLPQHWTALEQLYYYEFKKGLAINDPTRCAKCRKLHAEYCRTHTKRMLEARERRLGNLSPKSQESDT